MTGRIVTVISSLLLIFLIPIVGSLGLFYFRDYFYFATSNYGTLLPTPISLNTNHARHWSILLASKHCNRPQIERLVFYLHQLRKALGENQNRVDVVLWTADSCQIHGLGATDANAVKSITLNPSQVRDLQQSLKGKPDIVYNKIYLIDPHGNLLMYYSLSTDLMNIYRDLNHLLKASQIG